MIAGVANAPCSWGLLEFDLEQKPVGYARVLDEMAEAGYAGTELGDYGFLPVEPGALREALDKRGLALVAGFVPVPLADPDAELSGTANALRSARLMAEVAGESAVLVLSDDNGKHPDRTANAGQIGPGQGFSPQQWQVAAHTLDRIALVVYEETGLRTAFHPHCAGYVKTPEEAGILMELTHPRFLGFCLDTAHYAYGGSDPLQLIRRYGERIRHVHLKGYDVDVVTRGRVEGWGYFEAIRQGVFCELAENSLDFAGILEALDAVSYSGWVVVEQDVMPGTGNPLESARKNREYLRTLGL